MTDISARRRGFNPRRSRRRRRLVGTGLAIAGGRGQPRHAYYGDGYGYYGAPGPVYVAPGPYGYGGYGARCNGHSGRESEPSAYW